MATSPLAPKNISKKALNLASSPMAVRLARIMSIAMSAASNSGYQITIAMTLDELPPTGVKGAAGVEDELEEELEEDPEASAAADSEVTVVVLAEMESLTATAAGAFRLFMKRL